MFVLESFAVLSQLALHYTNKLDFSKLSCSEIYKSSKCLVTEQGKIPHLFDTLIFVIHTQIHFLFQ